MRPLSGLRHNQHMDAKTAMTISQNESNESGPKTVLFIDDSKIVRSVANKILSRYGFSVISYATGDEAVKKYHQSSKIIDVVLLDMKLPGMTSVEVINELRRINHNVRIVITSGSCLEDIINAYEEEGVAGFLPKPFNREQLLEEINIALGKKNGASRKLCHSRNPGVSQRSVVS